jgi:hypothetical protein
MLAGDPGQGGASWAVLQYLLGLRRLGHEIAFVEQLPSRSEPSELYFDRVIDAFGMRDQCSLLVGRETAIGRHYDDLTRWARTADVVLNISGLLRDEQLYGHAPTRVYLDIDPAFTQLWHSVEGVDMNLAPHTHFVTVGQAIGRDGCDVPTCDLDWIGTLQPVVLTEWPIAGKTPQHALTSVGNWRGYGSIETGTIHYGQRAHSVRELIDLPNRIGEPVLLALAIHADESRDLAALAEHGWRLADPGVVADTPEAYRAFVSGSWGELGIAKSGYVLSRCGWFSDRSCCYLASGRPVLAQETGFSDFLPTGAGLFAFSNVEEACGAAEELRRDYPGHADAARSLAEEYFDSDRVLSRLLDLVHAA